MEAINDADLAKLCRLCLKPEGFKQPIFGIEGVHRGLSHKISVCFPFQVYETDPLPKLICHKCIYKVEQFYQFRTGVLNAFESAKKALVQRADPEICRYFSQNGEEPVTAKNTTTFQKRILQRTDTQTPNCSSEHEKEPPQHNSPRILQNVNVQAASIQATDVDIVLNSGCNSCNSPQEKTVTNHCENLKSPNSLSFGETFIQNIHCNETESTDQEENVENCVAETDVITQTLFDESFTRDLHNNAYVIVSREHNVGGVSDELDDEKGSLFDEMSTQDQDSDERTTASREENDENDNDHMDVEKHLILDTDFTHDQHTKTVNQIETSAFNTAQPVPVRMNDYVENFENSTVRYENESGTSNELINQRKDISPTSASPPTTVASYWCNLCLKYLKNRRQIKSHNHRMHNFMKPPMYSCSMCEKKFDTYFDLLTHNKFHIKIRADITDKELLECGICHKRYYDSSVFTYHLSMHDEKCRQRYQRRQLKTYSTKNSDKTAVPKKWADGNKADFVCEICMLTFKTNTALEHHFKSKVCLISCGVSVPQEKKRPGKGNGSLDKHSVSPGKHCVQTGTSGANVPHINAAVSYSGSSITEKHLTNLVSVLEPVDLSEQSLKNIQCSYCDKYFKDDCSLKRHKKIHIKSKVIKVSSSLYTSPISRIGQTLQADKYQCQYCYKVFSDRQILLSHQCLTEKPYTCCTRLLHSPGVQNVQNLSSTITDDYTDPNNEGGNKTLERKFVHTDQGMNCLKTPKQKNKGPNLKRKK